MSVQTKCLAICDHLRAEGYTEESDIPEQQILLAINKIVGGSKITEFRYMTDYLVEKYGVLHIKPGTYSVYRFVVPKKTRQAKHRVEARKSLEGDKDGI